MNKRGKLNRQIYSKLEMSQSSSDSFSHYQRFTIFVKLGSLCNRDSTAK
jgi:hypothetical protein